MDELPSGARGLRLLLRASSVLVAPSRRDAWRKEWEAELDAARRAERSTLRLALGAVPDAWTARRLARNDRMEEGTMSMREGVAELTRAARSLLRMPGFTAACVVTLGVGLGATAAIFTLVDAILLRPLPYPAAERLVRVYHTFQGPGAAGQDWPFSRAVYDFFDEQTRAFEVFGGHWDPDRYIISGDDGAEQVVALRATTSLLDVLGARTAVGRLFTEEDAGEAASGILLGHGLWQRRYGGDPSVVGRSIVVNGSAREVLGVMAEGVDLPRQSIDLWVPYAVPPGTQVDDAFRINVIARMADGVDLGAAEADMERLTARLPELAPFFSTYLSDAGLRTHVRALRQEVVGEVEQALWILLGAVVVVLVIAAANVANLFLVRSEGRRGEVALRSALGARRAHLLALFYSEAFLVSLAAGVLGVLLAGAAMAALVSMAPPSIPRLDDLRMGPATVLLAAALCVAVTLFVGAYPYVRFGRASLAPTARDAGTGRRGVGGPAANILVVGQVALALVLIASSLLLLGSFQHLRSVDPGFEPDGVLAADVSLVAAGYTSGASVASFYRRLVERTEALPGVRRAAIGASPLREEFACNGTYVEGRVLLEGEMPPCVPTMLVGPGYWDVLGIPMLEGRGFQDAGISEVPAVVVTENVARRLWPDGPALGRGVHPAPRRGPPWYRVVGVSGAVHGRGPGQPPTEVLYLPIVLPPEGSAPEFFTESTHLLVATSEGRAVDLAPEIRRVVTDLDPDVAVTVTGALSEELGRTMVRTSFTLFLLATAAATALVLGLVGLYGVVSYRVGARRHEIGIRMAMGAAAGGVRSMVLLQSMRLVLLGTAIGLVGAWFLTRLLRSLLFEIRPGDPLMLTVAAGSMLATALAASWIPAERATRVDPSATLRAD